MDSFSQVRCFKCEPGRGIFVSPSRARLELPKSLQRATNPYDVDFDISSDETDGDGASFGLSEGEEERAEREAAGGDADGAGGAGGALKVGGAVPTFFQDPATRLALALQAGARGKKAREETEFKRLQQQFVQPPHPLTLDEEGRHQATITVGHDSDAASGEWRLAVTATEPIVIHHVVFDVGSLP